MANSADLLSQAKLRLARFPAALEALVADLDEASWRARPAAGRWAPLEIVCHLRDEEREDFPARVKAVIAGATSFTAIAPQRWVEERRYLGDDPAKALAGFLALRRESLAFLAGLAPEELMRGVDHPQLGVMTGRDLLAAWAVHDLLHLSQLARTLARIQADAWAPLRVDYAGDIPYPPA